MSSRNKTQQLSQLSPKNRKRKKKNQNSSQRLKVKEIFNHGKINLETRRNHRRNGEMNAKKEMSEEVEEIEGIVEAMEGIKTNNLVDQLVPLKRIQISSSRQSLAKSSN